MSEKGWWLNDTIEGTKEMYKSYEVCLLDCYMFKNIYEGNFRSYKKKIIKPIKCIVKIDKGSQTITIKEKEID